MKILIAVDESDASRACYDRMVARHWREDTEFKLVTVMKPDPLILYDDNRHYNARHVMIDLSAHLNTHGHGTVVGCEALEGDPGDTLVEVARKWGADLIVVGANNKNFMQRTLLGSVSQKVLEYAPCPVLIIRDCGPDNRLDYSNVVVAIDGSIFSEYALSFVCATRWLPETKFHFLNVIPHFSRDYARANVDIEQAAAMLEAQHEVRARAFEQIEKSLSACRTGLSHWSFEEEVMEGDPKLAIVRKAREVNADLIVVGSHGLSGISRMLLGSVSTYVSSHARCSVLVVKPPVSPSQQAQEIQAESLDRSESCLAEPHNDYVPHVPVYGGIR